VVVAVTPPQAMTNTEKESEPVESSEERQARRGAEVQLRYNGTAEFLKLAETFENTGVSASRCRGILG
jgi:hypothetical protein